MRNNQKSGAVELKQAVGAAVAAAREAGVLLRRELTRPKRINETTRHDIKLELDVRCQKLIERQLLRSFPAVPVLGEEGVLGDPDAAWRWVVDPIDGTVNYTYGIPHACVSIALQGPAEQIPGLGRDANPYGGYRTAVGVVYDPFCDELWTACAGGAAWLNGRRIQVSKRTRLGEAIITVGFAKHRSSLDHMLPVFTRLIHRVRKLRIMGSAALALTYVASGRFDGYIESGIRLWDIAAGALILESAGGRFWCEPLATPYSYRLLASNGPLHRALRPLA